MIHKCAKPGPSSSDTMTTLTDLVPGFYNCASKDNPKEDLSVLHVTELESVDENSIEAVRTKHLGFNKTNEPNSCFEVTSSSYLVEQFKNHQSSILAYQLVETNNKPWAVSDKSYTSELLIFALNLSCQLHAIQDYGYDLLEDRILVVLAEKVKHRVLPHIISVPFLENPFVTPPSEYFPGINSIYVDLESANASMTYHTDGIKYIHESIREAYLTLLRLKKYSHDLGIREGNSLQSEARQKLSGELGNKEDCLTQIENVLNDFATSEATTQEDFIKAFEFYNRGGQAKLNEKRYDFLGYCLDVQNWYQDPYGAINNIQNPREKHVEEHGEEHEEEDGGEDFDELENDNDSVSEKLNKIRSTASKQFSQDKNFKRQAVLRPGGSTDDSPKQLLMI